MTEVHVDLMGHSRIDFDRRIIRKALRKAANPVRREARRLIARRNGGGRTYRVWGDMVRRASAPGAPPARLTAQLGRSIDTKMVNDGFAVYVGPNLRRAFYARFLAGGTQAMAARPFMDLALEAHAAPIAALLETAMVEALQPR